MIKSTSRNILVIYDGNCRFCNRLASLARRLSIIPEDQLKDYYDLDESKRELINAERFREEMAVVDPDTKTVSYGVRGILLALSYRFAFFHPDKIKPGPVFTFIYRLIALNRYVIMPPPAGIRCDCEPDLHKGYRTGYLIICIVIALLFQALFFNVSGYGFDLNLLILVVTGWMVPLLFVRLFNGSLRYYEYMGHLASVLFSASAVLIPLILLMIAGIPVSYIYLCGTAFGTWMHYKRMKRMNYQAATFIFLVTQLFIYIVTGFFI